MSTEKNEISICTNNKRSGFVYVASSDSIRVKWKPGEYAMPYKIGRTTDVDRRIGNLNGAVPVDFRVWLTLETDDMVVLENEIHNKLAKYRYPRGKENTEFFVCALREIKEKIDHIIRDVSLCKKLGIGRVIRDVKTAHCGRSAVSKKKNRDRLYSGELIFICTNRQTHAIGRFVECEGKHKFKVVKGSIFSLTPTPAFRKSRPYSNVTKRDELFSAEPPLITDKGELLHDVVFNSPSAAASVITASSQDGNCVWRELLEGDSEGKTLGFFLTGTEGRVKRP